MPDSRGTYLIGEFEAYQDVSPDNTVTNNEHTEFHFPTGIETIDYTNLYSEVSALLCAYNTGMIADVVGEMLAKEPQQLEHLRLFQEAVADQQRNKVDFFTLNHDCLLERFLRNERVHVVDGFDHARLF